MEKTTNSKNGAPRLKQLSDVPAIEESRNLLLRGRADVMKFVESPLVRACEIFFDKGIQTLASSCNPKDIAAGSAYVIINYGKLSPENQETARSFSQPIDYDNMRAVKIEIPITSESSVEDIEQTFASIADSFDHQDSVWIPTYTMEMMRKIYGIPDDMQLTPESFTEGSSMVWDPEKQVFYDSEELRTKASK